MTLLFYDGFEGGPLNPKTDWLNALTINTGSVRTGTFGLQGGSAGYRLGVTPSAKIIMGYAYFNGNITAGQQPVSFYGDSNSIQHLTLTLNPTTQLWELRRGAATGTLLATGTHVQESAVWRNHQVSATVDDTTGTFVFKIDGVNDISFTGDTRNGGVSTNIDSINFMGGNSNSSVRADDLWICNGVDATATQGRPNNDFLGDLKVNPHIPNAAGDLTQWTPSVGANYTTVDEVPANTTDYVSSNVAGNKDLYNLTDLPAGANTVYGVQVLVNAQKTDAGARGLKTVVKENSVVTVEATDHPLSVTYTQYQGPLLAVKPSNSAVWAPTDVNAMQAGVECEAS